MSSVTGIRLRTLLGILASCLAVVSTSFAESLWNPDSPGLFAGTAGLQAGDTLLISIDINQDLAYDSSRIDSERVSIELTGGEGEGLFSFLPTGSSSGNQSLRGSEEISFQASFAVSVVDVDEDGNLVLRGGRTVDIQGEQAAVTLTGTADPSLVGEGRSLPFSSIVDARIVYETFLTTGAPIIQPEDIEEVPAAPAAEAVAPEAAEAAPAAPTPGAEEAVAPGAGETGPGAAAIETEEPVATVPALTEEKKRELLLMYINRFLDLIFE